MLHKNGIYHGEIRANNFSITEDYACRLNDFQISVFVPGFEQLDQATKLA